MNVTVCGLTYACATALKGSDYVHLVDESGTLVAAFEGVSDFSIFALAGGSWTTPKSTDDCNVAVWREDGTLAKCGTPIKQFLRADQAFSGNIVLTNGVQYGSTLPSTGVEGQIFFKVT